MTKIISIEDFLNYMDYRVEPIEGLNIPNITVPSHLVGRKRTTEAVDTIAVNIRYLFNSLTQENLPQVKEELNKIISEKAKTASALEEVAAEMLDSFLMSEQHIKNYMHLLNMVSKQCRIIPTTDTKQNETTPTIGYYFLDKCKGMITNFISEENMRKLAELDQYDEDDLDKFNRERDKINNLIVTLCSLYEQRNTSNIKLTAYQLYPLINNNILEKHAKYYALLKNMDEDEDVDYELYKKICNLYAEQVYIFLSLSGNDFVTEQPFTVREKTFCMTDLVLKFKADIVPTISESYLKSKCDLLKCCCEVI